MKVPTQALSILSMGFVAALLMGAVLDCVLGEEVHAPLL
jgi:hypothetical protein